MPGQYRVRYRNGDFELEIESTDKAYVDAKLNELLNAQTAEAPPEQKKKKKTRAKTRSTTSNAADESETPGYKTKTILLMGDFNMIPGQDVSNFHHLGGEDLMDFVSCWDLQDRFSHILDKGRANLLDGFAVSRTYATDYVRGSLRLFPMHWTLDRGREWYKDNVSDHLPFVASFKIN